MSRAEEQALKAYPAERGHMHDRPYQREGFVKGYEQAQKDLELSWRDMQRIVKIADHLCNSLEYDKIKKMGEEGYYTEILEQFNKEKYGNTQK